MMIENCDKYIKKAKYGTIIFLTIIITGVLKKMNIFNSDLDIFFIIWVVFAFILSTKLSMPYFTCLLKYKHKV